ncbi:hypothetical protein [Leucobacter insecticola]|uniref:hypothetical protein n=1 Tax=Leucobacter insecticola TaxID=2714934 RepID=UPI001FCB52DD|nr:hypothetical protein [Leucobacter insecticola]
MPGEAVLVTRDHDPAGRIRGDEIARLCSQRGLQHYVLDGPRAQGGSSWISSAAAGWDGAELLRYFMPGGGASDVFVCGPEAWMRSVIRDLRRLGVPAKDIHSELFTV